MLTPEQIKAARERLGVTVTPKSVQNVSAELDTAWAESDKTSLSQKSLIPGANLPKPTVEDVKNIIKKEGPTIGMIGGGFIGGALGNVPGAILGSGIGGAAGEAVSEKLKGEDLQPTKIATEGAIGAGMEALGGPIVKGAGKLVEAGGKKLVESVIPTSMKEADLIRMYRAGNSLFERFGQAVGLSESVAPRTAGVTAAEKGLMGTESMIGVQATQEAKNLWKNILEPQIKGSKAILSKEELFAPIEKRISETVEPGKRQDLIDTFESIKEDYKKFAEYTDLDTAQALKRDLDKETPEKLFKGKNVADEYKTLKNDMADAIREKTYNVLPEGAREAFLDYGNLVNLQKLGTKAISGSGLKGASFTGFDAIKNMALVPVGTIGGRVIYRTGEGLEFIGKPGARVLRDLFAPVPQENQ